jgi:hypothetical protein
MERKVFDLMNEKCSVETQLSYFNRSKTPVDLQIFRTVERCICKPIY